MKKIVPVSEGTLHDHRPLFIIWLVFVIVIVGALSFLPALALGPVAEFLTHDFRRVPCLTRKHKRARRISINGR